MSNYLVDGADLTSVANAIRAKSGGSSQLAFPAGFVSEIGNIPSGGADNWIEFNVNRNITTADLVATDIIAPYHHVIIHGDTVPKGLFTDFYTYSIGKSINTWEYADPIKIIADCAFYYCSKMVNANFPDCEVVGREAFCGGGGSVDKLETAYLPKVTKLVSYLFRHQVNMTSCQVGSVGYPVNYSVKYSDYAFNQCTQSGLTITLYTNAANVDTVLSKTRAQATNATIVIKASENLTYGGSSYSAGDTIVTSTI